MDFCVYVKGSNGYWRDGSYGCVKSPFRYFIIYEREIVYKRKKGCHSEDTESHLGVVEFMFICIVLPTVGNLTFIS